MSEPIDLTSRVLEQIRDELRGLRGDMAMQGKRMELVETTLRDLAEQTVMMTRGLETAIESRARDDARLDDHERRLSRLESTQAP